MTVKIWAPDDEETREEGRLLKTYEGVEQVLQSFGEFGGVNIRFKNGSGEALTHDNVNPGLWIDGEPVEIGGITIEE